MQLLSNPIKAIMSMNTAFSKLESENNKGQMLQVKGMYILTNLLLVGLGIYKIHYMGLLPTTRSDWLAWEKERQPLERAYFAFD